MAPQPAPPPHNSPLLGTSFARVMLTLADEAHRLGLPDTFPAMLVQAGAISLSWSEPVAAAALRAWADADLDDPAAWARAGFGPGEAARLSSLPAADPDRPSSQALETMAALVADRAVRPGR